MKFFSKFFLAVILVVSVSLCTATCVHADEIESLLEGDSSYQLKENASIPGISLEDELTRDQLVSDLESILDAQAQEELLISLMETEDKVSCGENLALWQYFREDCR